MRHVCFWRVLQNTPHTLARPSWLAYTISAMLALPQGILEGIRPGAVYVDLSTSRPTLIRHIEPQFRAKGAHVLDTPVSSGSSGQIGAAARHLAVMVGGEREVYDRIKPILDAFGDKVFYARASSLAVCCWSWTT
jgi:3-hydroxyisobutyrate dehydrogenase-like beta-hydroxyacid dehydrogenase